MSQEIYIHVRIFVETGKFAPSSTIQSSKVSTYSSRLGFRIFDGSDREASLTLMHSEAEEKSTPGLTYVGIKGRRARTGHSPDRRPTALKPVVHIYIYVEYR